MPFDIQGAKQEGYTDSEIANYLATEKKFDVAGARKEGYGDADIIQHLQGTGTPKQEGILDKVKGVGEGALTTLLGATSWIPTGIANVADMGAAALAGQEPTFEMGKNVSNALDYQPTTEVGKAITSAVQYPFKKLEEGQQWAGDKVYDVTGSPVLAAAAQTAVGAVPFIAGGAIGKGIKNVIKTPTNILKGIEQTNLAKLREARTGDFANVPIKTEDLALPETSSPIITQVEQTKPDQSIVPSKAVGGEPDFKTGQPVTFDYIHNTEKSPNKGTRFGQDKEPTGIYIQTKSDSFTPQNNLETGTVTFNNPLVIDWGGGYGEPTNWKNVLSEKYNGKTGKALSNAIQKDGYDGVVTISKYGSSEIVKFSNPTPLPEAGVKGTESRLAIRTEAVSLEKGLTQEPFGELAGYEKIPGFMKDQSERAVTIMDTDWNSAIEMGLGKIKPPDGTLPATMYKAVEKRAIENSDFDTLYKLGTESTIPERQSLLGREIKAADVKMSDSPLDAIQEVRKARESTNIRLTGQKPPSLTEVSRLKQTADTAKATLDEHIVQKEVDNILKTDNPLKEPKVKYGSRNKLITTADYEIVKNELSQQLGSQLSAGLDPTIAVKLGKIGTYHFEAGIRNFELWSHTIIKDVGEWVKPHLADLWKQVNETVRADIALRTRKTRMINETQQFTDKLNNLDFSKKEKHKTVLDMDGLKLQVAHDTAKKNYQSAAEAAGMVTKEEVTKIAEYSKDVTGKKTNFNEATQEWTKPKDKADYGAAKVVYLKYVDSLKNPNLTLMDMIRNRASEAKVTFKDNRVKAVTDLTKDAVTAISDVSISFVASIDNSFLGRQGLNTLLTHPTIWASAAKKSFADIYNTMASKHGGEAVKDALLADVYSRPNYMNGSYDIAKLIPKSEEQFPTSIPEKIPLGVGRTFKASENAFVNSAIRMRTNTFDLVQDIAKKNGVDVTDKVQIQEIGKLINSVTARGDLGRMGDGGLIRVVLWAPKMLKGNWDVLTAHTGGAGLQTPFARQQARINLLKIVASTSAVVAVANGLSPGCVETDPRSSDFLKIRVGNTRYDISGGKGSIITLLARAITFSTKSTMTGKITPLNSGKYGAKTVFDVGIDFLVNKTTPAARTTINVAKGRDFQGQKPTAGSVVYGLTTPISIQNFVQNFYGEDADGSVAAVVGSIVDIVGINSNTYAPQKKKITDLK